MSELRLPPTHQLFKEMSFPDTVETVEVSLGANPSCAKHLEGTGVPCVVYPKTKTGMLGTGAHPGFVVEFPIEDLVEAGADEDECWYASGANPGTYQDEDGPVCADCLSASGEYDQDAEELPKDEQKPCWSCVTMVQEGMRQLEEYHEAV